MMMKPTRIGVWSVSLGLVGCAGATAGQPATPEPPSGERVAASEVKDEHPQQVVTALSDAACRQDDLCGLAGLCVAAGDSCVAASEADCRRSAQCTSDGACGVLDGECVARTDGDCSQAEVCRAEGRCRARDGYCTRP